MIFVYKTVLDTILDAQSEADLRNKSIDHIIMTRAEWDTLQTENNYAQFLDDKLKRRLGTKHSHLKYPAPVGMVSGMTIYVRG